MADGDFYSKYTGEEIEKRLDGSVLFNEYQELSDIQKQQVRRNIGAGTVDSGLIIKGYYATYEELTAAQPNPQISDAYGVGTEPPYNIFVWDSVNKMWVNNGTITKGDKGDPGKDGEAPTAENIAAALGYTPAATDLSNVEDGAVSGAKIANGAVSEKFTATIPAAGWTGNSAPYTNIVTVPGLLEDDDPGVDIIPSDTYETAEAEIEAYAAIYRMKTAVNTLTALAREKPTVDINIQLKAVRK